MPYRLFDTAFGTGAVAWSEAGLTRVLLPEGTRSNTEARVRRGGMEASGMPLSNLAVEAVAALKVKANWPGTEASLETLRLDDSFVTSFNASIYRALRGVPRGTTVTYGNLARQVRRPRAARAVGGAPGRNPWPIIVPCHRVFASGGEMAEQPTQELKAIAMAQIRQALPRAPSQDGKRGRFAWALGPDRVEIGY